ncbi:MAG: hypothetical protein RQ761_03605 [Bacteroidales bacterium]|nr:hypothetical protein [Bacteroidales bacterium]
MARRAPACRGTPAGTAKKRFKKIAETAHAAVAEIKTCAGIKRLSTISIMILLLIWSFPVIQN